MTRVLRRPMFRMGGNTTQGIMSGVAPRQGYSNGEIVNPRDLKVSDLGDLTIGQMQDLSKVRGGRSDLSQFLIDFGLDVASATPSGSIFSTAAKSAQKPFERFQQAKQLEEAYKYKSSNLSKCWNCSFCSRRRCWK